MKKELLGLDDDPDIPALCKEALAAVERAQQAITLLLHPALRNDAELVCELDGLFGNSAGVRCLAIIDRWPGEGPARLPHNQIAPELFDYAKEIVANC